MTSQNFKYFHYQQLVNFGIIRCQSCALTLCRSFCKQRKAGWQMVRKVIFYWYTIINYSQICLSKSGLKDYFWWPQNGWGKEWYWKTILSMHTYIGTGLALTTYFNSSLGILATDRPAVWMHSDYIWLHISCLNRNPLRHFISS